jgi:hypothetical protein
VIDMLYLSDEACFPDPDPSHPENNNIILLRLGTCA